MSLVPFFNVARCTGGNDSEGNDSGMGTPFERSTVDATALSFLSTGGSFIGAGVAAGSSTAGTRGPGVTVNVWPPFGLMYFAATAFKSAGLSASIVWRLFRKQPGSPA